MHKRVLIATLLAAGGLAACTPTVRVKVDPINIYAKLMAPSPLAALGNLDVMAFVRGGAPQFMYLWMP